MNRARTPHGPALGLLLLVAAAAGPGSAAAAVTRGIDYLPEADHAEARDHLDVHMPEGADGVPVLVYFHGGALMFGDRRLGDPVAERLLALGIGVVSASYRLSPAVQHPAHVRDAAAALAWTVRHIGAYGGDPGQIYVAGHSAGAYLAALLALDPTHVRNQGLPADAVAGAVLISPFLYVEETAPERPKSVWGPDPADWLAASVTPHIAPGKPPVLLLYADGDDDWRKSQNERLAAALEDTGNRARAVQLEDRDHRSLIARINEPDDRIGTLIRDFVAPGAAP